MFQRPRIVWVSAFGTCDASSPNAAFRTSSSGICCDSTRPRSTTGWIELESTRSIQATPHPILHFPLAQASPVGRSSAGEFESQHVFDSLIPDLFFVFERADVVGDQRVDTVPESASGLRQGNARSQPRRRGSMPTVVNPQPLLSGFSERTMPRPTPARREGSLVTSSAEQERIGRRESAIFDPLAENGDQDRRDRHGTRTGLRLTGLIERDVRFRDLDLSPSAVAGDVERTHPQHHHFRRSQTGVVGDSRHDAVCPGGRVSRPNGVDRSRHVRRARQTPHFNSAPLPRNLATRSTPRPCRPWIIGDCLHCHRRVDAGPADDSNPARGVRRIQRTIKFQTQLTVKFGDTLEVQLVELQAVLDQPLFEHGFALVLSRGRERRVQIASKARWGRRSLANRQRDELGQGFHCRNACSRLPLLPLFSKPTSRPFVDVHVVERRLPRLRLAGRRVEALADMHCVQQETSVTLRLGSGAKRLAALLPVDRVPHDPRKLRLVRRASILHAVNLDRLDRSSHVDRLPSRTRP